MQIDKLTISYHAGTDHVEDVFVKAAKLSVRAKTLDAFRAAVKKDENRNAELSADYTRKFIAGAVCDESGNEVYKPDDIDDWHPAKITAYEKAIAKYMNPDLETVAKNSLPTPTAAT